MEENTQDSVPEQAEEVKNESVEQQVAEESNKEENAEKEVVKPHWAEKRLGEVSALKRSLDQSLQEEKAKSARLEQEVTRLLGNSGNENQQHHNPDIDQLARTYADQIYQQRVTQETLARKLSSIEEAGRKEFGDGFDRAISTLQTAGIGGDEFLKVLSEIPSPEKVVTWMANGDNVLEAMRIASLPAYQMGIEMTKLSGKAAKEMSKKISNAPAPLSSVEGGSGKGSGVEPPLGSEEWFKWRNAATRRK